MKTVLITGAQGFVGRALCTFLAEKGVRVYAATRRPNPDLKAHPQIIPLVLGNLENISVDALLNLSIDTVIHCAARVHVMQETALDPEKAFYTANVLATERLAQAALKAKVHQFIFLSTIKVNGECTRDQPFTADDTPNPQDFYAVSKYQAEQWLQATVDPKLMSVVCIRPALIYGPKVKGNVQALMKAIRYHIPLPLGGIKNARSFLSVNNLCQLIFAALQNPSATGVFLAADANPVSTPELVLALAASQSRRACLIPIPAQWLEFLGRVLGKQAQISRLTQSLVVDTQKTEQVFNWLPTCSNFEQSNSRP